MINRTLFWQFAVVLIITFGLIIALVYWPDRSTNVTPKGEWTCSMHPQVRQNKPGQCPLCNMNLIPVTQVSEIAETEKRAGIETEFVKYRDIFKEVRAVGKLDYNESRVAYIAARISGRVERVYADFTGIQVKKGDHLVDIYSPDLFMAQGELLRSLESLEKAKGDRSFAETNLESARTKMRLLGILPEQLSMLEKFRKTSIYLTIYAPIGGTVIEKSVRSGQYVKEGDMLYRIADLDPIWLYLDIYEYDLEWIHFGQSVEVTLEAYPAEIFRGVVTFIDPFLDDKTRAVRARVNLKNHNLKLKPAMYASALIRVKLQSDGTPEPTGLEGKYICPMHPEIIQDKPGGCSICQMQLERVPGAFRTPSSINQEKTLHHQERHASNGNGEVNPTKKPIGVLALRASAVLDTGKRKVVYRLKADGAYEIAELQLGHRAEGKDDGGKIVTYYPVLKGLTEGDRVVVRGGFLLDSQQQILGMPSLLYAQGQSAANIHDERASAPAKAATSTNHKH